MYANLTQNNWEIRDFKFTDETLCFDNRDHLHLLFRPGVELLLGIFGRGVHSLIDGRKRKGNYPPPNIYLPKLVVGCP